MSAEFYNESVEAVCERLDCDLGVGLSDGEAAERLARDGRNELVHTGGRNFWGILLAQFTNLMVVILIVAAVVSFLLGDAKDAVAIFAIIILNAMLGFRQEFKAERAMEALKKLSAPHIKVRRGGVVSEIDARDLVCGDVVLLDAGDLVPADCRLCVAASLKVQESALTGESLAVDKISGVLEQQAGRGTVAVGDRKNMVHMGTIVTYGRGEAVVTATGMQTELGHVATLLQETEDEPTPLTSKIEHLGKVLVWIALGLIVLVSVIGILRGYPPKVVFMTAISMAVAAIPEGLPAVVTIALALGAKRMLARNALIRNLPSVETLGSVTAICTDKTGTLTQNVMTVTCVEVGEFPIADFRPARNATHSTAGGLLNGDKLENTEALLCLGAAALASDAVIQQRAKSEEQGAGEKIEALGDPTEGALVVAAAKVGLHKSVLENLLPRVGEAPFDSDRKRMSTLHRRTNGEKPEIINAFLEACGIDDSALVVFAKGAVGSILEVSTRVLRDGECVTLDDVERERILGRMEALAGDGIRVLGVAYRSDVSADDEVSAEMLERDLIFVGLIGMMDPLREDVKVAVAECQKAGIRPIMITGDHPAMAKYIAESLDMPVDGNVVTGHDIARMSEAELIEVAGDACVYARVSPEDKLRIVDALQARGEIASMTGDGVNDAPALKSADIGVAMGITGTDVAKGASDMVLLDDSYGTIVAAVREGRVIFDNIHRFIRFILAGNSGELLVMLLAPLAGLPLPLFPVQILWMNLVTDGLPALALGVEGPENDVMLRAPRDPDAPIIDWAMGRSVLWIGLLIAGLSLFIGRYFYSGAVASTAAASAGHGHGEAAVWQTMLFTTMVFAQLFLAMAVRSSKESLFKIGIFSNRPMILALAVTLILHIGVIYVPVMQGFFKTTALSLEKFGICVGLGFSVFAAVEIEKMVRRLRLAT